MNAIRRTLALALTVALALILGGCGEEGDPPCTNPAAPGCGATPSPSPVTQPSPSPVTTPSPAALDVTGGWRSLARSWNFDLRQNGSTLGGIVAGFKDVGYPASEPAVQITGTVDSSGNVSFSAAVWGVEFHGVVDPDGKRMTGTLRDCANGCRNYGEILEKR